MGEPAIPRVFYQGLDAVQWGVHSSASGSIPRSVSRHVTGGSWRRRVYADSGAGRGNDTAHRKTPPKGQDNSFNTKDGDRNRRHKNGSKQATLRHEDAGN